MYDLTLGQNGHFSQKNQPKEIFVPHAFNQNGHPFGQCGHFCQVNLLKSCDFL
jgi:hypothetical protein